MATYLDQIVEWHRARARLDDREIEALELEALAAPPTRDFLGVLTPGITRRQGEVALIAEVKRRSPKNGPIDLGLDAAAVAVDYERGGASCLSVLTDEAHFSGSPGDLVAARAATELPVLRKDFTISITDCYDARIMGADAVLLIAAVLDDATLSACIATSSALSMSALVEIHDEEDLERAVGLGARLIGVNQRDLHSFEVDTTRAVSLASEIPDELVSVAESGIRSPEDVAVLGAAGFDAVLVGEQLVRAADRSLAVRELLKGTLPCG